MLYEMAELSEKFREDRSEIARALAISRDALFTPAQRVMNGLTKMLTKPNKDLARRLEAAMASGNKAEIEALKKELKAQIEADIKALNDAGMDLLLATKDKDHAREMEQHIRGLKSSHGDRLYEYWLNGILSGPGTHGANTLGGVYGLYDLFARNTVSAVINKATGNNPEAAQLEELSAGLTGMNKSIGQAWKNAVLSFKEERSVLEQDVWGERETSRFDKGHKQGLIPGKFGKTVRLPTRFIIGTDNFLSTLFYNARIAQMAARRGKQLGKEGDVLSQYIEQQIENPESETHLASVQYTNDAMFRADDLSDVPGLGAVVDTLNKARARNDVVGLVASYAIPFVRTPANLARIGLTRLTPLSAVKTMLKGANSYRYRHESKSGRWVYKSPDAMYADIANSVMTTAAGMALMSMVAGDDDKIPWITGAGAGWNRSSEKGHEYRAYPPFSIRMGDRWVSYKRLDPFSTGIAMMVDAAAAVSRAKNGQELDENFARYMETVRGQLRDKTYMKAIGDIIRAIENPEAKGAQWATSFGSSWMPAVVRHATMATDDAVRNNKPDPTLPWGVRHLERVGQGMFPGVYKSPARVDPWGRDIKKHVGIPVATELGRYLLPFNQTPTAENNLDEMLTKWNTANPNELYYVPIPNRNLTFRGEKLQMNDEQYDAFLRERGKLITDAWKKTARVRKPNYGKPKASDLKLLERIVNKASTRARLSAVRQIKDF